MCFFFFSFFRFFRHFLPQLEASIAGPDQCIGNVFLDIAPFFRFYSVSSFSILRIRFHFVVFNSALLPSRSTVTNSTQPNNT